MTEQLAPGRFSWCKLQVKKWDGEIIDEDRPNQSWWDDFDKETISELKIIPIGDELPPYAKDVGVSLVDYFPRNRFFHFKRMKMLFGMMSGNTKTEDVACVVGVVQDALGNAVMVEMTPDYKTSMTQVNVVDMKLNIDQQGISLTEGW